MGIDSEYYIYEDPDFSITESPLSTQDVEKMGEAVKLLRQLSGFQQFAGMEGIVGRLEDLVHVAREKSRPVIFFDKNGEKTTNWYDSCSDSQKGYRCSARGSSSI